MTEKWPTYEVASEDVVHALGVMNINYLRFETTHVYMLSAVSNISTNQAAVFCARINPTERATILDRSFQMREWPEEAKIAVEAYIKGMRALTENRNTLIHGNVVDLAVGKAREPAIISMGRDGRTTVFKSSLPAIRQVADDLYTYSHFGSNLSSYVATEFSPIAREAGMLALSKCPTSPSIPKPIKPPQSKVTV
ncbi:hypothetical protein [Bradyrhizobium genosp. P]|uniref:hypothetical protein n=1 Tax=Bradyrhizobium genosp. P TaxID=83641 RepID=UPI003CED0BAA